MVYDVSQSSLTELAHCYQKLLSESLYATHAHAHGHGHGHSCWACISWECMCMCIHVRMCMCIHVHEHVHTCACACAYMCMCMGTGRASAPVRPAAAQAAPASATASSCRCPPCQRASLLVGELEYLRHVHTRAPHTCERHAAVESEPSGHEHADMRMFCRMFESLPTSSKPPRWLAALRGSRGLRCAAGEQLLQLAHCDLAAQPSGCGIAAEFCRIMCYRYVLPSVPHATSTMSTGSGFEVEVVPSVRTPVAARKSS